MVGKNFVGIVGDEVEEGSKVVLIVSPHLLSTPDQ